MSFLRGNTDREPAIMFHSFLLMPPDSDLGINTNNELPWSLGGFWKELKGKLKSPAYFQTLPTGEICQTKRYMVKFLLSNTVSFTVSIVYKLEVVYWSRYHCISIIKNQSNHSRPWLT